MEGEEIDWEESETRRRASEDRQKRQRQRGADGERDGEKRGRGWGEERKMNKRESVNELIRGIRG